VSCDVFHGGRYLSLGMRFVSLFPVGSFFKEFKFELNGICIQRGRAISAMGLIFVALEETVVSVVNGIRFNKGLQFESNGICISRGRAILAMGLIFVTLCGSW